MALDADGTPSFNALQNYGSAGAPLHFFVFDLLVLNGKDVMAEPLVKRRELLEKRVLPRLSEPVRYSPELKASLKDLIQSVKAQGLEGLVAKRRDSKYEPGLRSGVLAENACESGTERRLKRAAQSHAVRFSSSDSVLTWDCSATTMHVLQIVPGACWCAVSSKTHLSGGHFWHRARLSFFDRFR